MTAYRNCGSRQDLLGALTLAVEKVHPAAARTIVDYLASPLSDRDLSDLVQSLGPARDGDDWSEPMPLAAQARLLDRINHAKTRYATFLRARNQHDVQIQWPYEHSLCTLGLLHSRELATFFERLWSRRYTHCAVGSLGPHSYRCFSVVISSDDFARLCTFAQDRRVVVTENVLQTFGPLEGASTPRTMQDIHLEMVTALHDIHLNRFDMAASPVARGNEPWFPFPNAVRQSNETVAPPRLENVMLDRRLDTTKDWDRGKADDVVLRNAARARGGGHRTACHGIDTPWRPAMPSHWKSLDHEQGVDFFNDGLGDGSARGAVRWPELAVVKENRYDKAARRPPPKGYVMEALSSSGEDSASVAVASLSTVNGDLQRMKSFVQKPSRGETLQPATAAQDVDTAQAEALPTPPSPNEAVPMSGKPPSVTGLATPPDSASPVKPRGPPKRVNTRRAPKASAKIKARRPQVRRTTPNKTDSSSTTTASSRVQSVYSMEDLKMSAKSSSTTVDTPSPTKLWTSPVEGCKMLERRGSSGLATFSPTKQATTSVQHIEVVAQLAWSVAEGIVCLSALSDAKEIDVDKTPPQEFRKESVDSTIGPIHRSAVDALKNSMSPKCSMAMSGECNHGALDGWR
ncbi:peptidoglycan-binding protein [Diplodia corticola]|uniref:Peptidoglycan-binding protein n=1 Tax=Diplodia corticola TaxID=236234 RepID=A0A1J9QLS5_9PEZI|nr:peptidoglycan-binding protein [Diplodia corticola]OJD29854.1 peptidoglycan-binding protein [Diplodia corticola]